MSAELREKFMRALAKLLYAHGEWAQCSPVGNQARRERLAASQGGVSLPAPEPLTPEELERVRECPPGSFPAPDADQPPRLTQRQVYEVAVGALPAPDAPSPTINVDWERVCAWMRDPNRAPATIAFTAGAERQLAYAFEDALTRSPAGDQTP